MTRTSIRSAKPDVPIKVFVLEDQKWDQKGIQDDLGDDPRIQFLGYTGDPEAFLEAVETAQPHVAIIDLRIQDDDEVGLHMLKEVKARVRGTKCLILTRYPDLQKFQQALTYGAEGFVRKEVKLDQDLGLLTIVTMLAEGKSYYDPELVKEMHQKLTNIPSDAPGLPGGSLTSDLTPREFEILEDMAEGLQYKEIARKRSIRFNTVRVHTRNILEKLHATNRATAVGNARQKGLLH